MLITRKYYKGALVAYFKKNNSVVRYPVFRTDKKNIARNMRLKENPQEYNAGIENVKISEAMAIINDAIVNILSLNPNAKLSVSAINEYLGRTKLKESNLVNDLEDFINQKWDEKKKDDPSLVDKFPSGLKDYKSLKNCLQDYEYDEKRTLTIDDIDEYFIEDLIDYLFEERPKIDEETQYKYKTEGNLVNKTLNKRLESFSAFVRGYYQNDKIASLIFSHRYSLEPTDVIRINREELENFAKMELETDSERMIRDYFVFLCLTGLRFSDFISLKETNFTKTRNGIILRVNTQKTRKKAEIPLVARAVKIAKSYDYKFDNVINQVFNRSLKDLLEKYELFGDKIAVSQQRRRHHEENVILRREKISAHTGRRTFISILVEEGMPLQLIMGMTGHTQIKTLQIYIDKFSPEKIKFMKVLDF